MMYNYIGIDIAKESFEAALPAATGKAKVLSLSNNTEGFMALEELLPENACVVMEASGPYHLQLAFFLSQKQIAVSVVNPLSVKRFAQMRMQRAKTDKKDAILIADYAALEKPALWQAEEEHINQLKQTMTVLEQLHKQRTASENQRQALELSPHKSQKALEVLNKQIKHLEESIKELEQELEDKTKQHCSGSYEALRSIPGIGAKTAAMLIAITGNFERFATVKQLVSYVGLNPRVFESGTSVRGRGRICKMGMSQIRKLLYMCSWSAKRYNAACKAFYERLKEKGKPERVIKIAIANKLLRIAFAVAKKQASFDKNYVPKLAF